MAAAHGVAPGDYKDLVLFLATAGIVAPLFQRFKISPILGFLAAGVALGPFGLGALSDQFSWLAAFTMSNPDEVRQLAEFGVVFLLFTIGLELSWERLRLMRRLVFGFGALQVLLCGGAAAAIAMALGRPLVGALTIGAALALSSTAVSVPSMVEKKRLHSSAGRATFSVLLFQDLAVAPILIVLGVLGQGGGQTAFKPSDLLSLLPAIVGLLAIFAFGRFLLRPMMKSVARAKSEELFVAATLLVVIGAGLIAALTGLSMALGAFVAGFLLAETEYRHQVETTVEPFKGLLLGLFFVSVGINLDVSLVIQQPLAVLAITAGLIVIKALLVFAAGRTFKLSKSVALEAALALAAGGEFAFVVLNEALASGVVDQNAGKLVLVSATLSMFAIPGMVAYGARIGRGLTRRQDEANLVTPPEEPPGPDEKPQVMIVGFGRVGRLVADMLDKHEIPWVAVERAPRIMEEERRKGRNLFFGDASRPELLRRCGLMTAPALVVTMDEPETTEAVVASARELRPEMVIVARARDARHAGKLYALGATNAVPETIEASLQLSEALLVDIGVPMGLIIASVHEKRDEYRQMLNRPDALGARVRRARDRIALGP
jgi:CPA2 family monovalent cation:H+ antiporter-2